MNLDNIATESSHIPIKLKAATPAKTAVTETCDRFGKVDELGTVHHTFQI